MNLALRYGKDSFLKDALGVIPSLVTGQSNGYYVFKLIRFYKVVNVYDAISDINLAILLNFMYKSAALKALNIINILLYMF